MQSSGTLSEGTPRRKARKEKATGEVKKIYARGSASPSRNLLMGKRLSLLRERASIHLLGGLRVLKEVPKEGGGFDKKKGSETRSHRFSPKKRGGVPHEDSPEGVFGGQRSL